jgi:hypothetical protein
MVTPGGMRGKAPELAVIAASPRFSTALYTVLASK